MSCLAFRPWATPFVTKRKLPKIKDGETQLLQGRSRNRGVTHDVLFLFQVREKGQRTCAWRAWQNKTLLCTGGALEDCKHFRNLRESLLRRLQLALL